MDKFMTGEMQSIDKVKAKYGLPTFCAGLFHLMDCGRKPLSDSAEIAKCKAKMIEEERAMSGIPIATASFLCQVLDCAGELAQVETMDLIRYIKDYVPFEGTKDCAMLLDEDIEEEECAGRCPRCGYEFSIDTVNAPYGAFRFCYSCGQRIEM